jgi:uncharacterized YigZ family protein
MPVSLDPGARPRSEQIIKRSRFLARLRYVDTEKAADEFLTAARESERGAGHHCFAYLIGDEDQSRIERYGDDGEPNGTAGAPILNALKGRDLVNVIAVVSRYYGGIKLGTGGLARAYSGAVIAALEGAVLRPRIRSQVFRIAVDHATAGLVDAGLRGRGFEVAAVHYGPVAEFTVVCADGSALEAAVGEITSGTVQLFPTGHVWR